MHVGRFNAIEKALRPISLLIAMLLVSSPIRAERLPIKTYTTVDGLANNAINRIVRDSRGFLWFCTYDGLSRFDGYAFTNYGTDQGLPHREVSDFLETREGEFWVATSGGLVRFDPRKPPERRVVYAKEAGSRDSAMFTVVVPEEEDRSASAITALLQDRGGTIWCGTYKGLYRLDRADGHFRLRYIDIGMADGHEGRIVNDLLQDRGGSLWVATPNGLYRIWPDGSSARYTKRDGLPDDYLHSLLEDHRGQLWAGTRYGGFFQFEADDTRRPPVVKRAYSIREGMPNTWVFQLFEASDDKFWVASAHGLLQFFPNRDEQGRSLHSYTERNGVSFYDITALNEDLAGNLWLGTPSGAMKLERNGFITYDTRDGIYLVSSIFGDRAGGVCFRGTVVGDERTSVFEGATLDPLGRTPDYHYTRLGRFNAQRFTWFMPDAISNLGWINEGNILQTRNGEWWVGGGHGLYRFPAADNFDQIKKARPLAVYTKEDGLGAYPYRLFEDSQGNVWVSAWSATPLLMWDSGTQIMRDLSGLPAYPRGEGLPRSFGQDGAGGVWIGLNGQIARYRDGSLDLFTERDGVPPGLVTSIYLDHTGRLWLTSARSGLIRIDNPAAERPAFFFYTTADGLSANSTEVMPSQLIVEDLQGHIYVGTGRALDRLDPATGHFRHFTTADGLAPGSLKACFRDRDGALWFGTIGGLSRLMPATEEPPEAPPPILISGIQVAGSRQFVSALGETEMFLPDLTAGQNQLQIDFVGLSFAPGGLLRYQYKLQGDADWSAPTEQRSVTYRLAAGRYKFMVRAVNSDGVVSSNPAVITFRILPPLWARWWSLTLAAIGLTLVLYRFYRYRVARLLELERVRTRIATDLHDDIGSSLSRMAILSEVAKRRLEGAERESVSILSDIAESARGVTDSMSDIVWAIDPRRDDVRNLVFRIRQFASDLLGAKGIAWTLQAPAEFDKIKLNPQQRRHLFLIFKEAINNSARHAGCNSVWLSLSIAHNHIIGEIRDDGRGIVAYCAQEPRGDERGGQGLENIRMRAAQLGGDLIIDSSPGEGTSVRVEVPLKRAMA